jgi:hypothetical protein
MTQLGMKILYTFFLAQNGLKVPELLPDFPRPILLSISSTELEKSPLGNFPDSLFKNFDSVLPTETLARVIDDKEIEWSKDGFFDRKLLTDVEIDEDVNFFTEASWPVFYNCWSKFLIGCKVILAPNEVILDSTNSPVFSTEDVEFINFYGREAPEVPKRLTVEIYVKENIEPAFVGRVKKFFNDMGVSIFSMKSKKLPSYLFDGDASLVD